MADVTETLPFDLPGRPEGGGIFGVNADAYDVAVGELPFNLYIDPEGTPYERGPAPWQKEQFDNERNVGEQSLTGWWLRSQQDFGGGSGITYYEPLLGEGSETRFRDSRGVDVLVEPGEVSLLHKTTEIVNLTSDDIQIVASDTRLLIRDGTTAKVWNGSTLSTVTLGGAGATTVHGIAYTGSLFLIGHNNGIDTLPASAGTATTQLWNATSIGAMRPYWAKQRIFAIDGVKIYELTLGGGDPTSPDQTLYTHPDAGWTWTGIAETGGAVWASGYSGDKSAVHVITIDPDGSTPTLNGGTVGIQMPDTERANAIVGYLDFLVVGTSEGLRVAVTDDATAQLGPLIFDDEPVYAVAGRGDFLWAGCANALTRKVSLGFQIGSDLDFAWANDLEGVGSGAVKALAWYGGLLCLGVAADGVYQEHATELVTEGYLATGFARFGTTEIKYYQSLQVQADCTSGVISLEAEVNDLPTAITDLTDFNGAREVNLNLPGSNQAERLSIIFTLQRGSTTTGPTLRSYQLRAMPAPQRRQRLIRLPLMCIDREDDRWGNSQGGAGFAWARLHALETVENLGIPIIFRDFRTGEARSCIIESATFGSKDNPARGESNFGGRIVLTVRTLD